ncbi:MAG: hypothetical protein ACP5MG_11600 [Verrucomicrobiia bacterium]
MNLQGKYNFYAGSICAVLFFVCASAYSAYNPCIERPQFLNPKFALPEFAKAQFEKPKMEIPPPIEKPIVVQDPFVKPVFERPNFVLPKFQDCAAIKQRKTALEQALADYPKNPSQVEGIANHANDKINAPANNPGRSADVKSNPNEFYFYKPTTVNQQSGSSVDECCGAQIKGQINNSAPNQVVSVKKLDIR